jgi:hypothetical protein
MYVGIHVRCVLLFYDFNRNGSGATYFNTTPKCQFEISRGCCLVEVAFFYADGWNDQVSSRCSIWEPAWKILIKINRNRPVTKLARFSIVR